MASFTAIANELAKKYVESKHKKYALNEMIFEINYLSCPKTKKPLDFSAKAEVYHIIHELLCGTKKLQLKDGEDIYPEFENVTLFFERRRFHLKQLQVCNSQRALLN